MTPKYFQMFLACRVLLLIMITNTLSKLPQHSLAMTHDEKEICVNKNGKNSQECLPNHLSQAGNQSCQTLEYVADQVGIVVQKISKSLLKQA